MRIEADDNALTASSVANVGDPLGNAPTDRCLGFLLGRLLTWGWIGPLPVL